MDELVQRLSEGDHPVVTRRADSVEELKQSIDRGYVRAEIRSERTTSQPLGDLGIRKEALQHVFSFPGFVARLEKTAGLCRVYHERPATNWPQSPRRGTAGEIIGIIRKSA